MKKISLRKLALGAGMLGVMAMPVLAHADSFNFSVNLGGDDQAHFDFRGGSRHHDPMIWRAAQELQNAKHTLWNARNDFHGHKADAVRAINAALDQLSMCEHR